MSHRVVVRFEGIKNAHAWDRPAWVAAIWRLFTLSGMKDVAKFHDYNDSKGFIWNLEEVSQNNFSLEFASIREDLVQAVSDGAKSLIQKGEALSLSKDVILKVLDVVPVQDFAIVDGSLRLNAVSGIIVNRHTKIGCGKGKRRHYAVSPYENRDSYLGRIKRNLIAKVRAFCDKTLTEEDFGVSILSAGLSQSISYQNISLQGYPCSLQITGPKEVLEVALYAGVGTHNGFGCGMLTPMRKER